MLVIASGGHKPVVIPFPDHERLAKGLDFLKAINNDENPPVDDCGLLTHAIDHGREAAEYIDYSLAAKPPVSKKKLPQISLERLSKELFRAHNRSRFNFTDTTKATRNCISCSTWGMGKMV